MTIHQSLVPSALFLIALIAGPTQAEAFRSSVSWSPSAAGTVTFQTLSDPVTVDPVPTSTAPEAGRATTGYGLFGFRWDPCQPITYRIHAQGGYRGAVSDIRRAFRRIGAVTGVRFIYLGTTSRIAQRDRPDPRADVTVSWTTPAQVPKLRGGVAALADTVVTSHDGVLENVKGAIALDRSQRIRPGFASTGGATWGQVLLHEIGHVMGLDHVDGRTQVMYPSVGRSNHLLGRGDLARFERVGRDAGCIPNSARRAS